MGFFPQLWLILKKNLIFRKRNPGLLSLELIWPVATFLTLAFIRTAIPPQQQHQCHYAPRSLPSAGGFKFLQSFVCNLDNTCFPNETAARHTKNNPRISEFLRTTATFTDDMNKTGQLLTDISTASEIFDHIQDAVNSSELQKLTDGKLAFGYLLKDRDKVHHELVNVHHLLSSDVLNAVLDSSINITKLYQLTGYLDIKSIVCDPDKLKSYLYISDNIPEQLVSSELCAINDDQIPMITELLQQQLNVTAILRMITDLKRSVGEYSDSMMLEDITKMLDVLLSSNTARTYMSKNKLINLQSASKWLIEVVTFMKGLAKDDKSPVNVNSIQAYVMELDPIITQLTNNASWWSNIRMMTAYIYKVMDVLKGEYGNLGDVRSSLMTLFGEDSKLSLWIKHDLNLSSDSISDLLNTPLNLQRVSKFIMAATTGDIEPKRLICQDPGLLSIFNLSLTDRKTEQHLFNVQKTLCSKNFTETVNNIAEVVDISQLKIIQSANVEAVLKQLNWTELYLIGKALFSDFGKVSKWINPVVNLWAADIRGLWTTIAEAFTNKNILADFTNPEKIGSWLESYSWITSILTSVPQNRMILLSYSYLLDVVSDSTELMQDAQAILLDLIRDENTAVGQFTHELIESQEQVIKTVVSLLVNPDAFKLLTEDPDTFLQRVACNTTYIKQYLDKMSLEEVDPVSLEKLLCKRSMVIAFQKMKNHTLVLDISNTINNIQAIMAGNVDVSSDIYDNRTNLTALYYRTLNLTKLLSANSTQDIVRDWKSIQQILSKEGMYVNWTTWMNGVKMLQSSAYTSVIHEIYMLIGQKLEASNIWHVISPYLKAFQSCEEYENTVLMFIKDTVNQDSKTGRLIGAMMDAVPDLIDILSFSAQDDSFAQQLAELTKTFCKHTSDVSLPDVYKHRAITNLKSVLCNDSTQLITEWQNIVSPAQECMSQMLNNEESQHKPMDWDRMFWSVSQAAEAEKWSTGIETFHINMTRTFASLQRISGTFTEIGMADLLKRLPYVWVSVMQVVQQIIPGQHTTWSHIQFYAKSTNQLLSSCIPALESVNENGIRLADLATDEAQVYKLVNMQVEMIPNLMEAFEAAVFHPDKVLLTSDLAQKTLCKDLSLSDFITFDDISEAREYEHLLCNLDLNVLLQELARAPALKDCIKAGERLIQPEVGAASEYEGSFDWTELLKNLLHLEDVLAEMTLTEEMILPDVIQPHLGELQQTAKSVKMSLKGIGPDYQQRFYESLDVLMSNLTNLTVGDPVAASVVNAIREKLISDTVFMTFINKQLKHLVDGDISKLLPSAELGKLLDKVAVPDILQQVLSYFMDIMIDPTKLSTFAWSYHAVCPKSSLGDNTVVEKVICDGVNIDWPLVGRQLIENTDGLADIMHMIENKQKSSSFLYHPMNISSYSESMITFQSLMERIITDPPTVSWKNVSFKLDQVSWNHIINRFVTDLDNMTKHYDYRNLGGLITVMEKMLLPKSNQSVARKVYSVLNSLADVCLLALQDLPAMFEGLPHIQRLAQWQKDLPDFFATLVLSSVNERKFAPVRALLFEDPAKICQMSDIEQYLTIPQHVKLDFNQIKDTVCDTSAILQEGMMFVNRYSYQSVNKTMNVTMTMNRFMALQQKLMTLVNTNITIHAQLFPWLEESAWNAAFEQIMPNIMNMKNNEEKLGYSGYIAIVQQLLDLFSTPELNSQMHLYEALLQTMTTVLDQMNNRSVSLPEVVSISPRIQNIFQLVLNLPEILSVLITSFSTPQFQRLLTYNLTTAAMQICHPQTALQDLFTFSNNIHVDADLLKQYFCNIDISSVSEIPTSDSNIAKIIKQSHNTAPVNWTEFITVYTGFSRSIERFIESPANLVLNYSVFDEAEWRNALKAAEASMDPSLQTVLWYKSVLKLLPESAANSTAVMNSILSVIMKLVGQFVEGLPHSNITLEQITGSDTVLLDYLKMAYHTPIELTKALLHATIKKPGELLVFIIELSRSENPLQFYCNHTLASLLDMFQIPGDVDLRTFYNTTCNTNLSALGEDSSRLLGLKATISNLQRAILEGQVSLLQSNESEFLADYQHLVNKLQDITHSGVTFKEAELNAATVVTLLNELLDKYSNTELTNTVMRIYGSAVKIVLAASRNDHSLDRYFKAAQIVLNYFSELLQKLSTGDRILHIARLFRDSAEWDELLTAAFKLSAQLPDVITKTNIKINKFSDIFLMKEKDIRSLLCNVTLLKEYFTFPVDTDLHQLVGTVCRLNTTQLVKEIQKLLNIDVLSQALLETWNKPPAIDVEGYYTSYNNFLTELINLMNITEVDFFGVSLSELSKQYNISWPILFDTLTGNLTANPEQLLSYSSVLEKLDAVLKDNTYWTRTKAALAGAQIFMNVLSGKVEHWPSNATVRDLLVNASYVSDYIERTFALAPDVVSTLLSVKIDWVQFFSSPQESFLCSNEAVYQQNINVESMKKILCDVNFTALVEQIKNDWNWPIIRSKFKELSMTGDFKLDWNSYLMNVIRLKNVLKEYFKNAQFSEVPIFFLYEGDFNTWLSRLQQAFTVMSLTGKNTTYALIENSVSGLLNTVEMMSGKGDIINTAAVELTDALKTIINVVNKWLRTKFRGNKIKLVDLLGSSTDVYTLLTSALQVQPVVVQTLLNAKMSPELILLLVRSSDPVSNILCNITSLSEHLQLDPKASISFNSLQRILCNINVTVLGSQLQNVWDIKTLIAEFTRISQLTNVMNTTINSNIDIIGLIKEWQQLIDQSENLLQQPTDAADLLKIFNTSQFMHPFNNIFQQGMTKIIMQTVKSGLEYTLATIPSPGRDVFGFILKTVNDELQIISGTGIPLQSLLENGTAIGLLVSKSVKELNISLTEYSVRQLSEEVNRTWLLYEALTNLGYFNTHIDPQTLLNILQQPQMYSHIIQELGTTEGAGSWWSVLELSLSGFKTVAAYFNSLLENSKDGKSFRLEELIPSEDSVSSLLSSALNPTSAKLLLLTTINPKLFSTVLDQDSFIQVVCDPAEFQQMFNLPNHLSHDSVQLQKDLCEAAASHKLVIQQMLDITHIQQLYKEVVTSDPSKNGELVASTWIEIQNLVRNIQHLVTTHQQDRDGVNKWLANVQQVAAQMQQNKNTSLIHYVNMCNTTVWWLELLYPGKVISNLHWSEMILETMRLSMNSLEDVEDFICELHLMNLTEMLKFWESTRMAQIVKLYQDVYSGKTRNGPFSCDRYVSMITEFASEYSKIQNILPASWNKISMCLSNSSKTNIIAFSQLNSIAEIWQPVQQLLKVSPEFQEWIFNSEVLQSENIFKMFFEEKPKMILLEKIWKNTTDIKKLLYETFNLTPLTINQIMSSSITLKQLAGLNITNVRLTEMICTPHLLDNLLTLTPGLALNATAISEMLCGPKLNQTLNIIKSGLNLTSIMSELYDKGPTFGLSTAWLSKFVNTLDKLIDDMASAFELSGLLNNWQEIDQVSFLGTLQNFIHNNSPERIFQDITVLLENLRNTINSEAMDAFFNDFETISQGIQSLSIMKKMPFDSPIYSLINQPAVLRKYMNDELNISEDVTNSILKSSILYEKLAKLRQVDVKAMMCSPEELAELFIFEPLTDVPKISASLCQLKEAEVAHIVDYIVKNLKVGEFIKRFIGLGPETILTKLNLTKGDVHQVIQNLADFQRQFGSVLKGITALTDNVEFPSASEALTMENKWQANVNVLGEILCDHKTAFDIKDSYRISDTRGPQHTTDTVTEYDAKQLNELQTEFCKDVYKTIKKSDNGHIVWSYLKPLIRGKVLYTPKTPESEAIMSEATQIFESITTVKELTFKLSSILHKLVKGNNSYDYILLKKTLSNSFISGAMTEVLGINMHKLLNDLEPLRNEDMQKITTLIDLTYNMTECLEDDRLQGYASEEELEEAAREMAENGNLLAGVVFINLQAADNGERVKRQLSAADAGYLNLPKHIKYTIRMDIENTPSTDALKDRVWRQVPEDDFASDLRYLRGFVQLQDMIDTAIIKLQAGNYSSRPSIDIQQFPYPCHKEDQFQMYLITYFMPIMMFLAWFVAIASAIYNIVYDRERRLEETMSIMGLRNGVNWTGWFINTILGMLLISAVITLILKLAKLMPNGNLVIIFLFLADFSLAMTMFCYMISAFFTQTSLAILSGVMAYLTSYLPFVIVVAMQANLQFWHNIFFTLSATTAFSYGNQLMSRHELQGPGIQWENIKMVAWHFSFDWCCYMMLIDAAVYFVIGWYVRHVFPGKYGVGQPWYFCLSPKYWCKSCYKNEPQMNYLSENGTPVVSGEPDPSHLPAGISTHSLHKDFKKRGEKPRVAVNRLNVNFYRGQITALLGENGAGKTTTVNLLTGYLRPTSGYAIIEGHSIITDVSEIRQNLGICPQFDVLYHYMTVYEHLDMFVSLKNKGSKQDQEEEIHRMLKMTKLEKYRHTCISKLSGGQRRRLEVVLAFVGGSKVIILDEPTSGIDPCARRSIWDLIVENKEGRTIILCTHDMDEAEALSDRIVIMHKGKLLCSGSSLYLKKHFGSGYHLTINKIGISPKEADLEKALHPVGTTDILKFILHYVPDAYISEEIGMELTVVLPTNKHQVGNFPRLFSDLDLRLDDLCIQSYGISDSTLEEVFLKLVKQADCNTVADHSTITLAIETGEIKVDQNSISKEGLSGTSFGSTQSDQDSSTSQETDLSSTSSSTGQQLRGAKLKFYQFWALFLKRFHHHRRDVRSYFSQLFLPIMFICLAMACTLIKPRAHDLPSILLNPSMYGPGTSMFFRTISSSEMNARYVAMLLQQPGIGTTCMADSDVISECVKQWDPTFHTSGDSHLGASDEPKSCVCKDGFEVCPPGASGRPMPYMITPANNHLFNITGAQLDTEDYLLRSQQEFLHRRYGGWEFGTDLNRDTEAVVWWDNKAWHALPAYYNSLSNIVLRANVLQEASKYGISTYNHPLPKTKEQLSKQLLIQGIAETGIALTIFCAFCFIPAGYVIYLVSENLNKEKRLQFVSGVGISLYWFTAFLWDMLAYVLTVALATVVTLAFQIPTYTERLNLAAFVSALTLFGWCLIPFAYLLVPHYNNTAVAYMMTFIINLMIGILTTTSTFILSVFSNNHVVEKVYHTLSYIFLIFPQFCVGDALVRLSRNQFLAVVNERFHVDSYINPFSSDMIMWHLIAMACEGLLLFIVHFLIEARLFHRPSIHKERMDPSYKEDEDVSQERQRVMNGEAKGDLLVLSNLKKYFKKGRRCITAVDNVTLGIPRGQCFGLLGVNGAGKTTAFNMITGEVKPTAGAAFLKGKRISKWVPEMDQQLGYCPQEGGLDANLTVAEVLSCYGRLKGLQGSHLVQIVNSLIKRLRLAEFRNKTVKSLSGGTRRKLSTAVALLGDPDILLMDEPTSGMDPVTRRLVWNIITDIIKENRSVILTSHSMEECEAVCSRLTIMVNGCFMCLGNQQHIQQKFGNGYLVKLKTTAEKGATASVVRYILDTFNGAEIKERQLNVIEVQIPYSVAKLSKIFSALEAAKAMSLICDYSISQTSLDQVFISFAQHQHEDRDTARPDDEECIQLQTVANPSHGQWFGNSPSSENQRYIVEAGNNNKNVFVINTDLIV